MNDILHQIPNITFIHRRYTSLFPSIPITYENRNAVVKDNSIFYLSGLLPIDSMVALNRSFSWRSVAISCVNDL